MKTHCDFTACKLDDCPHHICNAGEEILKDYQNGIRENFAHLEGNPIYCKKTEWNGNQFNSKKNK